MTQTIRTYLIGIVVVWSLSATATAALAQCSLEVSVFADGAVGNINSNGEAEVFGFANGVDNSSCDTSVHAYGTSVTATLDNVPVFYGESESLWAEASHNLTAGLLRIAGLTRVACPFLYAYEEAEDQVQMQLPPFPTGETTQFVGWGSMFPGTSLFWMTLTTAGPDSFSGRSVREEEIYSHDDCFDANLNVPYYHLSGSTWPPVDGNNQYGNDSIGWTDTGNIVNAYRQGNRTPCEINVAQSMQIDVFNGYREYQANAVHLEVADFTIWVSRAGQGDPNFYTWP